MKFRGFPEQPATPSGVGTMGKPRGFFGHVAYADTCSNVVGRRCMECGATKKHSFYLGFGSRTRSTEIDSEPKLEAVQSCLPENDRLLPNSQHRHMCRDHEYIENRSSTGRGCCSYRNIFRGIRRTIGMIIPAQDFRAKGFNIAMPSNSLEPKRYPALEAHKILCVTNYSLPLYHQLCSHVSLSLSGSVNLSRCMSRSTTWYKCPPTTAMLQNENKSAVPNPVVRFTML